MPRRTRTELISQRKVRSPFAEKRQGDLPAEEKTTLIAASRPVVTPLTAFGWRWQR